MSRPMTPGRRLRLYALAFGAGMGSLVVSALVASRQPFPSVRADTDSTPPSIEAFQQRFERPPSSAAPMMRWWWFGPSVTTVRVQRSVDVARRMHSSA
jgi:hypothetical protein